MSQKLKIGGSNFSIFQAMNYRAVQWPCGKVFFLLLTPDF